MNLNRLFKLNDTEQRYIDGGTGQGLLITNTVLTGLFVWAVYGYMSISGSLDEGLINRQTLLPVYSIGLYIVWGIANAIIKKWVPYESVTFISALSYIICGYNGYAFAKGVCVIKDGSDLFSDQEALLAGAPVKLWIAFAVVAAIYAAAGFIPAKDPYSRLGFLWFFNVVSPLTVAALVIFVFKAPAGKTAVEAVVTPLALYELAMGYLAARYAFKLVLHAIIGDIPPEGWETGEYEAALAKAAEEAKAAKEKENEAEEPAEDYEKAEEKTEEIPAQEPAEQEPAEIQNEENVPAAEEEQPAVQEPAEAEEPAQPETEVPVSVVPEEHPETEPEGKPVSEELLIPEETAEPEQEQQDTAEPEAEFAPVFPTFEFEELDGGDADFTEELQFDNIVIPVKDRHVPDFDEEVAELIEQIEREESK